MFKIFDFDNLQLKTQLLLWRIEVDFMWKFSQKIDKSTSFGGMFWYQNSPTKLVKKHGKYQLVVDIRSHACYMPHKGSPINWGRLDHSYYINLAAALYDFGLFLDLVLHAFSLLKRPQMAFLPLNYHVNWFKHLQERYSS